ncbi:MAG: hypothetical protein PUP92_08380 [Rhizonema sp. PD38]|nr:hypothetical protein [Rhizonema sp. PD38]
MGRNSRIVIAAILVLAIAACSSEEEQKASNPTPTSTPSVTIKTATQPFNNPVVPAKQSPQPASVTPSLIRLTNATERVNVVSKGRTDPFGQIVGAQPLVVQSPNVITAKPVPTVPAVPTTTRSVPIARSSPIAKSSPIAIKSPIKKNLPDSSKNKVNNAVVASRAIQKKANPHRSVIAVLPKVLPQVIPNQTLTPVLPSPPQPELAKAVMVTGVVVVGNEPQAIIKVPNEPTSRYVEAGQRLANGVLIKRIEMNQGSEPIVIVEQYGIEVARMVGEGSAQQAISPASTGNPVSVTQPPQNPIPTGAM